MELFCNDPFRFRKLRQNKSIIMTSRSVMKYFKMATEEE